MIPGYQGTKQGMLAMERGEVGGIVGITWASVKATNGSWLREDKIRPSSSSACRSIRNCPTCRGSTTTPRTTTTAPPWIYAFGNPEFGRPFIAPPGVPAPVSQMLRNAFEETMSDPEFRADAEKRQLDLEFTRGDRDPVADRQDSTRRRRRWWSGSRRFWKKPRSNCGVRGARLNVVQIERVKLRLAIISPR